MRPMKNGNTADDQRVPAAPPDGDDVNPFHGSCWLIVEDWSSRLQTG